MYYGSTEPLLAPSFTGNIETPSESIFTGQLTREDKENVNVGKYKILQGTLELKSVDNFNKDNYNPK